MSFAEGVEVVGVDGDDTLWRCQDAFDEAEVELARLLADSAPPDEVAAALARAERANLPTYGFGVKAWTLNVLQVASELAGAAAPVPALLGLGRALLTGPVEVLPGAEEAVLALGRTHRVVLVTKGDLVDQRRKLAASGLAGCFSHVEIVPDKSPETYAELLRFLEVPPEGFLMVGNSEVSDVHPVLEIGGWAVHVPYRTTWVLERAAASVVHERRRAVGSLADVPPLLQTPAETPSRLPRPGEGRH